MDINYENDNKPLAVFGKALGGICYQNEIYYANRSNLGDYYISSEIPPNGWGTHVVDSYMGVCDSKYFMSLAEWRDKQIDNILGED